MKADKVISKATTLLVAIGSALCMIFAGQLAWWAAERSPPFEMMSYAIAPARAGETTIARALVKRDLDRRCSVVFSRVFFDSNGTRWELTEGTQMMNSSALEAYNLRSPDTLAFAVTVPATAKPGTGSVMTVLDYYCNPVHQSYPIPVVLTMNMEVLP